MDQRGNAAFRVMAGMGLGFHDFGFTTKNPGVSPQKTEPSSRAIFLPKIEHRNLSRPSEKRA